MVVGPRYNPAPVVQTVDFAPAAWLGHGRNDPVPDRDRISPPVLDPERERADQSGHASPSACRRDFRSAK